MAVISVASRSVARASKEVGKQRKENRAGFQAQS